MNEGDRLRELLDGSMDPSDLESYNEYYKLAERIYGREALDELGISSPQEIEEEKEQNGNSEFTHDVILPSPKTDLITEDEVPPKQKSNRRIFLILVGIVGLVIVSSNVLIGLNEIVPSSLFTHCEDLNQTGEIEFKEMEQVNGSTLTIFWTVKNITIGDNYTITWDISQNGSQQLVDSGSFSWQANGNTFTHLKSVNVQTEPYTWYSNLLDGNNTVISTTSGDYSSSEVNTMSVIVNENECEDNPKLIISEIMDYQNPESWTQAGDGDMLDGMLITVFALTFLFGIRNKKN
tara:strand:+ start:3311 stop:4186 length:876 start_codon:yes stop_codon:yes gene_type:complete